MRQFSFILILLFALSGCTLINEYTDSYKFKYQHSTAVTDFSDLTEDLLDDLCDKLKELKTFNRDLNIKSPIYITDFVNLESLENHSELGFMLSDELKTHVTQMCDWPIQEIEYTKHLKIGAKGTKLLSRDTNELKINKISARGFALVGTYAFTQRQLILYLKIIDLSSGVILKSSTESTELTDEIIHFEQRARRGKPTPIYPPMVL